MLLPTCNNGDVCKFYSELVLPKLQHNLHRHVSWHAKLSVTKGIPDIPGLTKNPYVTRRDTYATANARRIYSRLQKWYPPTFRTTTGRNGKAISSRFTIPGAIFSRLKTWGNLARRERTLLVITLLISPNVFRVRHIPAGETHDVNAHVAIPHSVVRRGAIYLFIGPQRRGPARSRSSANDSKFEGFRENCECARSERRSGEKARLLCGRAAAGGGGTSTGCSMAGGRFVRLKGRAKVPPCTSAISSTLGRSTTRVWQRHQPRSGKLEEVWGRGRDSWCRALKWMMPLLL